MSLDIKNKIKNILPPALVNALKQNIGYGWFGDYNSWKEAERVCSGYDSDLILEKCKEAALKVKNGDAIFERDSVLFYKPEPSPLVLTGLLHCAFENQGKLNVLDFGGSFGSSYYQNIDFLSKLSNLSLSWNIVEQENFVKVGKELFQTDNLKFYNTIEDCFSEHKINVLLLSSVLQYLENPNTLLDKLTSLDIDYIIFDKTAFNNSIKDIITVQKVSPSIYKASYPAWIFSESNFISKVLEKYDLILENVNPDETNYKGMFFKGYIFKIKK